MNWDEVFCHTFKAIRQQIGQEAANQVDFMLPSMPMVNACRADDFDFFQPLIAAGKLTTDQMHHATQRYHLGQSKSGQPIFWLIDDLHQPLDGLIMPGTWISVLLKQREPVLSYWHAQHCLFGLHLIAVEEGTKPVCLVEHPASAVLLSELFPDALWLSTMPHACFSIDLLKPLQGHPIRVFPNTDEVMTNYVCWLDLCDVARRTYHLDISCSSYLEDHASPDQMHREIDLLTFYIESLENSAAKPLE